MVRTPTQEEAAGNRLLAALGPRQLGRLVPDLELIPLELGAVVEEPDRPIRYVHFPIRGVIATVVPLGDGRAAEAGMTGTEGVVCLSAYLGRDTAAFRTVVENPGEAVRMPAADFAALCERSPALDGAVRRYADAFLTQVSQAAGCNAVHPLEQRCGRWLLMTLDRVGSDPVLLTQQFLAVKMGVTRTSVTEVARSLHGRGLIRYSRGRVRVVDRAGLEAASCECYRRIRERYDALLTSASGTTAGRSDSPRPGS